jgi:hypothetical protein
MYLRSEMSHLHNSKKKRYMLVRATSFLTLVTTILIAGITGITALLSLQSAEAVINSNQNDIRESSKAPSVVSGDNIYIAWWNGTAGLPDVQTDVMFRASTDGGATFSDRINLSNTTDADSWRVEIAGEGDTVVVSWWETNQTGIDVPVARISTDAGETFGELIMLGTNGTIGVTEEGAEAAAAAEGGVEGEEEAAAAANGGGE